MQSEFADIVAQVLPEVVIDELVELEVDEAINDYGETGLEQEGLSRKALRAEIERDFLALILDTVWHTNIQYYDYFLSALETDERVAVERILFTHFLKQYVDEARRRDSSVQTQAKLREKLAIVLSDEQLSRFDLYPEEYIVLSDEETLRSLLRACDTENAVSVEVGQIIIDALVERRGKILVELAASGGDSGQAREDMKEAHEQALEELVGRLTNYEQGTAECMVTSLDQAMHDVDQ